MESDRTAYCRDCEKICIIGSTHYNECTLKNRFVPLPATPAAPVDTVKSIKKSHNKEEYEEANKRCLENKRSKTRWHLLPWEQLEEVAQVFHNGAEKYTDNGWKYLEIEHYQDALSRHFVSYMKGEMKDEEWGFDHLSHLMADALILRWLHGQRKD